MAVEDERVRIMDVIAQLERRIDTHDDRLNALSTVPGILEKIDRRMWEGDQVMRAMSKKMDDNTLVTESIRDAQVAGKVVHGVGKWIGGVIIFGATVWAAVTGLK